MSDSASASTPNLIQRVLTSIRPILLSYSEIFFLKGVLIGSVILGLTMLNPNLGVSGLFSILTAYAFARYVVGYQKEFLKSGHYTYNALLVGLSIGQLFEFSSLSALYIAIAAILTFLITVAMVDVMSRYFLLPVLSIPFVIVTSLIYLAAARFSNLYVNELYATGHILILDDFFPLWIQGLLKSMGAVIFMPSYFAGLVLLTLILVHSRILFFLAIGGYYFGILLQGAFTGSYVDAFYDLNTFNYPLIAMAIGAIFNIPTLKSTIFAMTGVAAATVLIKSIDIFWSQYGIPVFTLPFLMITLGFIYVLGLLHYPNRPLIYKRSPEETAEYFYTQKVRYPVHTPFHLPILDEWSIYQGFDGPWTHQGIWKYAYDFVKRDQQGRTYQNEGLYLEDYYCYHQPVVAPCRGYVAYTASHFPDNAIGVVDTLNQWGNYVVIQDVRGYYVGICHLAQGHVYVKPGDWVEPYQHLGLCGNSGYSPEPHIHFQYQTTSLMTSATMPFCYYGVLSGQKYAHHLIPEVGDRVAPAFTQSFYQQVVNFILDDELSFAVYYQDQWLENICFKAKMAIDGTFYLADKESRLYLGKNEVSFFFYHLEGNSHYLKMIYQALPSMPLTYLPAASWQDTVPEKFFSNWINQLLTNLKRLAIESVKTNASYRFRSDTEVEGTIQSQFLGDTVSTYVELDPYVKFKTIRVGDYQFIQKTAKH